MYRYRKETVGKYFPVEMFAIKSLNVQFRSSSHIADLCSKLHGSSRGFTGARTTRVFTSSQVECAIFSFRERTEINLDSLADKFGKTNRWVVVLCDSANRERWRVFLEHKRAFAKVFIISWLDSPVKCDFSGAEIFSLTLVLDAPSIEEKLNREIIEEMYKLIISRAQYELCIHVHESLRSDFEMFLSCRRSQSQSKPKIGPPIKSCDEAATVYKTIAGGTDPNVYKTLAPILKNTGLSNSVDLCLQFLEGKANREIFVLLGRKFGQETIRGLMNYVSERTANSEKCAKRLKVPNSTSDFFITLKDIVIHALRINNREVLEWIFRLVDFTDYKEAIRQDISPEGPNKNLILVHTCFKPQLMKLCWDKLDEWGLLQQALRSKLHIWQDVCGILPILCYANAEISEESMQEYLRLIPNSLVSTKFCGKSALHHTLEHGNLGTLRTLLTLDGAKSLSTDRIFHENQFLLPSEYAFMLGHETIGDELKRC